MIYRSIYWADERYEGNSLDSYGGYSSFYDCVNDEFYTFFQDDDYLYLRWLQYYIDESPFLQGRPKDQRPIFYLSDMINAWSVMTREELVIEFYGERSFWKDARLTNNLAKLGFDFATILVTPFPEFDFSSPESLADSILAKATGTEQIKKFVTAVYECLSNSIDDYRNAEDKWRDINMEIVNRIMNLADQEILLVGDGELFLLRKMTFPRPYYEGQNTGFYNPYDRKHADIADLDYVNVYYDSEDEYFEDNAYTEGAAHIIFEIWGNVQRPEYCIEKYEVIAHYREYSNVRDFLKFYYLALDKGLLGDYARNFSRRNEIRDYLISASNEELLKYTQYVLFDFEDEGQELLKSQNPQKPILLGGPEGGQELQEVLLHYTTSDTFLVFSDIGFDLASY